MVSGLPVSDPHRLGRRRGQRGGRSRPRSAGAIAGLGGPRGGRRRRAQSPRRGDQRGIDLDRPSRDRKRGQRGGQAGPGEQPDAAAVGLGRGQAARTVRQIESKKQLRKPSNVT